MCKYIKFKIHNVEPLRIANLEKSQIRQVETLRYIPGSTIRGFVINRLSKKLSNNFDKIKTILLSDNVKFLNAYPSYDNKELVPSTKEFYSKREEKNKLISILDADDKKLIGTKRANLGDFCYVNNDKELYAFSTKIGESLNIVTETPQNKFNKETFQNDKDKNMFRMQYMNKGQTFIGYIQLMDEGKKFEEDIKKTFCSPLIKLGSDKSTGFGKCEISYLNTISELPFNNISIANRDVKISSHVYMLAISDFTMINEIGEICGLDLETLETNLNKGKSNIKKLEINKCSTSVININGTNSTWGTRIPSVPMYELGSVFKLEFTGELDSMDLRRIEHEGLGIRKSEGFGRVVFLDREKISGCNEFIGDLDNNKEVANSNLNNVININKLSTDEKDTLVICAKGIFKFKYEMLLQRCIQEKAKELKVSISELSKSQLGSILTIIRNLEYKPRDAKNKLNSLFDHIKCKSSKFKYKYKEIEKYINKILDENNLFSLMNDTSENIDTELNICGFNIKSDNDLVTNKIFTEDELMVFKLQLVERIIKYNGRVNNDEC